MFFYSCSYSCFWDPDPRDGNEHSEHVRQKVPNKILKVKLTRPRNPDKKHNHGQLRQTQMSILSMCMRTAQAQSAVEHVWVFAGALCISASTSDHLRPHGGIHSTGNAPISVQPKVSFSEFHFSWVKQGLILSSITVQNCAVTCKSESQFG